MKVDNVAHDVFISFLFCNKKSSILFVMPPRTSNQPRSTNLISYLAFVIFVAVFVFKLDVFVTQVVFSARQSLEEVTTRQAIVLENGTFTHEFVFSWGDEHGSILDHGELLTLSLNKTSGAGFQSRKEFLFAKIDMQIKLVAGNSAGTVTTYYLSSEGVTSEWDYHDEIDFEFLGNSSGNPYTMHTNVFSQGRGEREQQFFLWFDPTQDFHTYTILWNPKNIIFYVDDIPIREFKNTERIGVPYLKEQPMKVYSSLWNADAWATQGGRVKTNWSLAPFVASYRNYSYDGCLWSKATKSSSCKPEDFKKMPVLTMELDSKSRAQMKRLQKKLMVYDYCKDRFRFPKGPAPECKVN